MPVPMHKSSKTDKEDEGFSKRLFHELNLDSDIPGPKLLIIMLVQL